MAKEKFPQIGYLTVTESAANTLTFNGLSVFSNVLGQKGMIIHRIAYHFGTTAIDQMVGDADGYAYGLAGDDSMTSVDSGDPEVYDHNLMYAQAAGTPANLNLFISPYEKDFSNILGGGLIVPADRLYLFLKGYGHASAQSLSARFYYSIIDLSASDYLELAQAMRVLK